MSAVAIDQEREPSVLADFDTGYVLDELSSGIVVLDEQFCAIYANAIAQDLLAIRLPDIRGRPLPQLLPRPGDSLPGATCTENRAAVDYTLRMGFERWPENADSINVRIAPLHNQMSVVCSGRDERAKMVRFRSSAVP